MKRILFLISLVVLIWSCSSDSEGTPLDEITDQPSPKEYIVSLGMIGEILDIEESPLTKAGGNDLYGVQIHSKTTTTEYTPYAYGLFDDKSLMTIKLLEGYTYKFQVTMVVDGKNKIYQTTDNGYGYPFIVGSNYPTIKNTFLFDNKNSMYRISVGHTLLSGFPFLRGEFMRPNVDRFYGKTSEYVPSENGNISINMKRVVFGAKFIISGLTEGKLKISIKEAPDMYVAYGESTEIQDIYTFINESDLWTSDNYSETIPVSISWEKSDGAIVPLINKDITFKRNVLTTITIKVKDTSNNNNIDISQESGEMIKGDDITLESGTGLDNNVDPSK